MLIENNLRPEKLRKYRTNDENIGHVMDVDQVISTPKRPPRQDEGRTQDENGILIGVGKNAAAVVADWNSRNIKSVLFRPAREPLICFANEIDTHSLVDQCLCSTARPRIKKIWRKNHHARMLPAQTQMRWTCIARRQRRGDLLRFRVNRKRIICLEIHFLELNSRFLRFQSFSIARIALDFHLIGSLDRLQEI